MSLSDTPNRLIEFVQDGHRTQIAIHRAREWPAFTWPIFTLVFIFLGIYFTFLCDPPYPVLGGASFFLALVFAVLIYFRFASYQSMVINAGVIRRGRISIRGGANICVGNSAHIRSEQVRVTQGEPQAVQVDDQVVVTTGNTSIIVRIVRIILLPVTVITRLIIHRVDTDGWYVYVPTSCGPIVLFEEVAEDEALILARLIATALTRDPPLTPPYCVRAVPSP